MLAIVACGGILNFLVLAVTATEEFSKVQPEVLEIIKALTEPYLASFFYFPFQRLLPSRPALPHFFIFSGLYIQGSSLAQKTRSLLWQLIRFSRSS